MTRTVRKTVRNTALLVAFEVANPLLSLFLVGTLSRRLGAEGLGAYNLLINLFFVAHSFTSLGLNTLITREVSRDHAQASRFLGSATYLGLGSAFMGAVALELFVRMAGYGHEVEQCGWLVALALFPSIVILYSESIFIAFEKVQYIVYLALIENALRVLIGLWLLHSGYGVVSLMASFAGLRFLTLCLNLAVFRWAIAALKWRSDPAIFRELLRSVPVFGGILIIATLYARADVLMLSKMSTLAAVGFYTAAYRLFAITQVVPKSFNTSIYPVLSNLFQSAPDSYRRAKSLSVRFSLVILLPMAAGVYGLAEPVMRLLYGQEFVVATPVLKVVIWTLVPYGITKVLASSLFASNRQAVDLRVNLLGLGANLVLNAALIPRFGALGCAWATLLSICVFLLCQCIFLGREILPVVRDMNLFRPVLAVVAMLVWLDFTSSLPLALRVMSGATVYVLLLFVMQVIRLHEVRPLLPERIAILLPKEHKP